MGLTAQSHRTGDWRGTAKESPCEGGWQWLARIDGWVIVCSFDGLIGNSESPVLRSVVITEQYSCSRPFVSHRPNCYSSGGCPLMSVVPVVWFGDVVVPFLSHTLRLLYAGLTFISTLLELCLSLSNTHTHAHTPLTHARARTHTPAYTRRYNGVRYGLGKS